jgi:hypothetical protein
MVSPLKLPHHISTQKNHLIFTLETLAAAASWSIFIFTLY